jgi:hypothetical protein
MGASRDGRGEADVSRAWAAVRRQLGKGGRRAAERDEPGLYEAAVAAAVADMTAEELAVLRRKGRVPDWFAGEVRRHIQVVDRPNLKDALLDPLSYWDTAPIQHATGAALAGMMSP